MISSETKLFVCMERGNNTKISKAVVLEVLKVIWKQIYQFNHEV